MQISTTPQLSVIRLWDGAQPRAQETAPEKTTGANRHRQRQNATTEPRGRLGEARGGRARVSNVCSPHLAPTPLHRDQVCRLRLSNVTRALLCGGGRGFSAQKPGGTHVPRRWSCISMPSEPFTETNAVVVSHGSCLGCWSLIAVWHQAGAVHEEPRTIIAARPLLSSTLSLCFFTSGSE